MKKKLCILIMAFLPYITIAQVIVDSAAYLDINQVKALIGSGGMNFYDKPNGVAAYEYPNGSGKTTIFSSTLWIGGLCNGQLYLAGDEYRSNNKRDFYPGPVMDESLYTTELANWNKVWKINKSDIDNHKLNWSTGGYIVPSSISEWPVYGNTSAGQNAIQAPFVDADSNGFYNPNGGDYPAIRGDQAIYFIFNDSVRTHTQTNGKRLAVEVHGMAYAYNTVPELEKAIFINYLFYNRSTRTYDSLYIGNFTDVDLGFYGDDYVGCDSSKNMFYVYNANQIDNVYGNNPPVQTIKMLNLPMTSFVYFNNNHSLYPNTSDPSTAAEFYNYMKAYWLDGQHFVYGGNGYPDSTATTTPCNYIFPGYPNDSNQWNEVNAGNVPFDRRGLGVSGPYTLVPDAYLTFDLLFVTVDSGFSKSGGFPNVDNLLNSADLFQHFFDSIYNNDGSDIALGIGEKQNNADNTPQFEIFPNPVRDQLNIVADIFKNNVKIQILDLNGRIISCGKFKGKSVKFDVSTLIKGMYFVRIFSNEINQFVKFVKL